MIKLYPTEIVLLVIRRHWIVFVAPMIGFVIALVAPAALLIASAVIPALGVVAEFAPFWRFFYACYLLAVLFAMLEFWVKYYLDAWIITDQRIIAIEQHGLFHRSITEIAMERVQDVTIVVPGLLATFLGFGTITVQTASESRYTIRHVPDCYRAKDLILKHSRTPRTDVPHEPNAQIMGG
ncbi:PH domain-containing protein [Candidatus Parcubacteria bacterium]|nr:MAG: PH domain-containing protein [Candidatus Parcubacteria bacterium]